ncbi:MAG: erythromycin esterase family protein [Pedobacter sp.]|nr:MAG: erythromycin esterase family protein [Pedobacter sp.]
MKQRWGLQLNILFTITILSSTSALAQSLIADAINKNLIAIESNQPNDNFENFDQFAKVIENSKIVALGEVTHGVKEFLDFRITLAKHLVINLKYKIIVLESDFSGAKWINDYILYGKGNKYEAMNGLKGIWRNKEFASLIDWLKEYNREQSFEDKVKIYGSDTEQSITAWQITSGSFKLRNELSNEGKQGLKLIRNTFSKVTKADLKLLESLKSELKNEIADMADTSYRKHCILSVLQSIEWFEAVDWYNRDKVRDKHIAENLSWIYEYEKGKKTISLAHNIHIAKNPSFSDVKRAGNYLKEKFGSDYYVLGFTFFTGQFSAWNEKLGKSQVFTMPETKDEKYSEYVLSHSNRQNYILDFNSAKSDTVLYRFLTQKTYGKNIGTSYKEGKKELQATYMPLVDKFDGIAFFRHSKPLAPPY